MKQLYIIVAVIIISIIVILYVQKDKGNDGIINSPLIKIDPIYDPNMGGPFSKELLCDFKKGNKIYNWQGKEHKGEVKCGECNQYIYKSEDGCNLYGYDKVMNEESCDDNNCIDSGVCTLGSLDESTNKWIIDDVKKCPRIIKN